MTKHRRHGFTIVELIVIIVVVALIASISTIAYRSIQSDARDEKRKMDALMLQAAIEDYYMDNGEYPIPSGKCPGDPGGEYECWLNEPWQMLVDQNYLSKIPVPDGKAHASGYNLNEGNANYGWIVSNDAGNSYAIYIPLENHPRGYCKFGKNMPNGWWGSADVCDF